VHRVHGTRGLGHEDLDRPPDQLLARIAEQVLGLGVDHRDPTVAVHQHDAVRRRFDQIRGEKGGGAVHDHHLSPCRHML
jgi:hypothetical protein